MLYLLIIIAFIVSVLLSGLLISRILVVAFRKRLFDQPDERKIHTEVIPRLGGLSFVPTIFFSLAFVVSLRYLLGASLDVAQVPIVLPEFCFLVCGLTLLYLFGIKDDLVGLRYRAKFFIQFVAAVFFFSLVYGSITYAIFSVFMPFLPGPVSPFILFVVVFLTNAINLINGIDGLASGLSNVALAVLGSLFLYKGLWLHATLAFSTLIVPVFDVIRVVLVRARTHRGLFSPDRNHIHHKFLAMGFTPRRAMLSILGLACVFSCTNIFLISSLDNTWMLIMDIAVWTGLNIWFDTIRDRRRVSDTPSGIVTP